ncbi:MAG: G8 domain-containing protein [Pirellulales bacterium]
MKQRVTEHFRTLVSTKFNSYRRENHTHGYVPRFEQLEPRQLLTTTPLSSHAIADLPGLAAAVHWTEPGVSNLALQSLVAWEYNSDGNQEGWISNPGVTNNGVNDGNWNLIMSGHDPSLFGPVIAVDSNTSTIVEITMSSDNSNVSGQLFWRVAGDVSFSEQRSEIFTLIGDGTQHTYYFTLADDPDWTGTITQLRLDPVGTSHGGTVLIDAIRLLQTTTTAVGIGGDWHDPGTWSNGVPTQLVDVVIPSSAAVQLSAAEHEAKSLLIQGTVDVLENDVNDKTLVADWILVDQGILQVGTAANPYDTNTLVLTLEGDNPDLDLPQLGITDNNAFLMVRESGSLQLFGGAETSWTQLGATAFAGTNRITLKKSVTWDVGDEIVIASTTFDMNEAETRVITDISSDNKRFRLNAPLTYNHFGQIQFYDNGKGTNYVLDERAEVGLLSRNIKIQGDANSTTDGIGGNLMFLETAGAVSIDGVEFYHMGQRARLGRYPIHWHVAGDRTGDFVKNTSIHRAFNRALTIHASHNILVEQTVAYDHIGHGYFLEDAVETGNKFYYNLGLVTREPQPGEELLPSDLGPKLFQISGPGTFWITNPDNEYVGNVAGGSQTGSGFWYALPLRALGPSASDPQYLAVRPQRTALGLFQDNRAHSNAIGLDVDGGPDLVTGDPVSAHYNPPADANFDSLTAFANSINGAYFRGTSELKLPNARLADNFQGTMFAFGQTISDSLIVGVSDNDFGGVKKHGFAVYDGPNIVHNVHFAGFNHPNAGLFSIIGAASRHANHRFEEITFDDPATPLTFPNSVANNTLSRHWGFSLLDVDGTLTGTAGQSIIFDHPMMRTDGDVVLPEWQKAAVSQRQLGHLKLEHSLSAANQPTTTISRTGGPGADASHTDIPLFEAYTQIGLVMNTDFVYTVNHDTGLLSNRISINVEEVQPGDFVYVRIHTPWAWATISSAQAKSSEQEVRDSSFDAHFINPSGNVFVKLVVNSGTSVASAILREAAVPGNPPLPSGDFDADGNVGGSDFLAWQRGFGKPLAFEIEGDADGDFDVDADDLNTWKNQFGGGAHTASTLAAFELTTADESPSPGIASELDTSQTTELIRSEFRGVHFSFTSLETMRATTEKAVENPIVTANRTMQMDIALAESFLPHVEIVTKRRKEHTSGVASTHEQQERLAVEEFFALFDNDGEKSWTEPIRKLVSGQALT